MKLQQLRYLARGKKVGHEGFRFVAERTSHQVGDEVRIGLRVLKPGLLQDLPPEITVQVVREDDGQPVHESVRYCDAQ